MRGETCQVLGVQVCKAGFWQPSAWSGLLSCPLDSGSDLSVLGVIDPGKFHQFRCLAPSFRASQLREDVREQ